MGEDENKKKDKDKKKDKKKDKDKDKKKDKKKDKDKSKDKSKDKKKDKDKDKDKKKDKDKDKDKDKGGDEGGSDAEKALKAEEKARAAAEKALAKAQLEEARRQREEEEERRDIERLGALNRAYTIIIDASESMLVANESSEEDEEEEDEEDDEASEDSEGSWDSEDSEDFEEEEPEDEEEDEDEGESRWDATREAVRGLLEVCERFEPGGVTVYFFNSNYVRHEGVRSEHLDALFEQHAPRGGTWLNGVLKDAAYHFFKKRDAGEATRGETFLIITDGSPNDPEGLVHRICGITGRLQRGREELALSFVQVGDDLAATSFLEGLNDRLRAEGARFEICDTRPSDSARGGKASAREVLIKALAG